MRVAVLDLGTNTFRLLIADVEEGRVIQTVAKEQTITRLGGGFDKERGLLDVKSIERSLKALKEFAHAIKEHKPKRVFAVATEIVRRAVNGGEFVERAKREADIEIEVIPAQQEAQLAFRGICAYLKDDIKGDVVTLDVGGGSTEWVRGNPHKGVKAWVSLPLGVVELAEKYLAGDPPTKDSVGKAEQKITEVVRTAGRNVSLKPAITTVIGTGGTATSLAVLDLGIDYYDEALVQNHCLSIEKVRALEKWLVGLKFSERARIFPLRGGREDVIIPGAIITRKTMEIFGARKLLVSDAGLLEGLLLATAEKN